MFGERHRLIGRLSRERARGGQDDAHAEDKRAGRMDTMQVPGTSAEGWSGASGRSCGVACTSVREPVDELGSVHLGPQSAWRGLTECLIPAPREKRAGGWFRIRR